MKISRRQLLRGALAGTAGVTVASLAEASGDKGKEKPEKAGDTQAACLVDTTLCIGCRKCESACNRANRMPRPDEPFTDLTVLRTSRRPTDRALTVVNQYPGVPSPDQRGRDTTVKVQCMHCLDPACVSACIVGALKKTDAGPVVYDASICMGCRYCMVACPFQIPAYEYFEAFAPRVRKCEFCANNGRGKGANPACASVCPVEALVYGRRGDLLRIARQRFEARPDRYINTIYGEHEVGGTSWLYLIGRPPGEIGLIELPDPAPPRVTEKIQHTIFKYGAIPIAVYASLGALKWYTDRREAAAHPEEKSAAEKKGEGDR